MNLADWEKQRAAKMKKLCAERGIRITPHGKGWRVYGRGVDYLVANMLSLNPRDLEPIGEIEEFRYD